MNLGEEVERQPTAYNIFSDTSALNDVQEEVGDRIADQFDHIKTVV